MGLACGPTTNKSEALLETRSHDRGGANSTRARSCCFECFGEGLKSIVLTRPRNIVCGCVRGILW